MINKVLVRGARIIPAASMLLLGGLLQSQVPSTLTPVHVDPVRPSTTNPAESSASVWTGAHALTADDLGAYLDGIVPQQLKRENIAGAVVVVVKDGNVLFQRGYGYADVEKKTPMLADQTLVRPGSTSKLFTWTAVMQLVEQGKIDLDRDVNDYLDFKIPATYPKPITMRQLMTHTAGFADTAKDEFLTRTPLQPIGQYLRTHIPERIFPPGTMPAYSNYGATVAGYIVERISGTPFNDYVEQHIFEPLQMAHTTFVQPLPPQLQPLMSSGYTLATDKAKPYEIVQIAPAGSAATSAVDMSHFMLAHLQDGEWKGARILKPETTALMHSPQFAFNQQLNHMALGFYEETRNGHRILGHAGDTGYFHSDLHLVPDQNLGFFVSYNSAGRGKISPRNVLFQAFLDRYLPYAIPAPAKQPNPLEDARLVAGEYISSRRADTTIISFIWTLATNKVDANPDGTLQISGGYPFMGVNQVPITWEEVGPLLYRQKGGPALVGFKKDSEGRMVLATDFPFEIATKISFVDGKTFNLALLIFVVTASLLALIFWPIATWMRRHYGKPLLLDKKQRRWHGAIRIVCVLDLLFLLSWVVLLSGGDPLLDSAQDPILRGMQFLGWLGTLGTVVVLYAVYKLWRSPGVWWLTRAGNVGIALSALAFSWLLLRFHLLHFNGLY